MTYIANNVKPKLQYLNYYIVTDNVNRSAL